MTFRVLARLRDAAARVLAHATKPVVEQLETRTLLSGATHPISYMGFQLTGVAAAQVDSLNSPRAHPNATFRQLTAPRMQGSTLIATPNNIGLTAQQLRHLYGIDTLDAANASFPLYTNTGTGQNIIVIGSPVNFLYDIPQGRTGNLTRFDSANGVNGNEGFVTQDPTLYTLGGGLGGGGFGGGGVTAINGNLQGQTIEWGLGQFGGGDGDLDPLGEIMSASALEWTHAIAPTANVVEVLINTNNGAATNADLQAGIQQGIADLALVGGGTMVIPFNTFSEDPTIQAQYDRIFAQAAAKNVAFVGAAADGAANVSNISNSPFVTSVGASVVNLDAAGNRISETAWVREGGGPSTVTGMPKFQVGIVPKNKGKQRRGTPDLVIGTVARGSGLGVYFDDTAKGDSKFPWFLSTGPDAAAPIFGGAVALADELRFSTRQKMIDRDLNTYLYNAYRNASTFAFTDITVGNNLHQAGIGYDYATGLGAPRLDGLIESLGGIVGTTTSNVTFVGQEIDALTSQTSVNLTTPFRGTGIATFGPNDIGINFNLLATDGSLSTATLAFPLIARSLSETISGQGTATVVKNGVTTVFPIFIDGSVKRVNKKYKINATIFTIDANGQRVSQGNTAVFQGTIS